MRCPSMAVTVGLRGKRESVNAKTKHVLLVSDATTGGAAVSCRRLLQGLREHTEVRSSWLAFRGAEGEKEATVAQFWPGWLYWNLFRFAAAARLPSRWVRRLDSLTAERSLLAHARSAKPDVVNLHNIHGCCSFSLVPALAKCAPLVWTLHDMWALTGGCCYAYDCLDYREGCRSGCARGKEGSTWMDPAAEWRRRSQFFRKHAHRIAFVTPSRWLQQCARQRLGPSMRVEHIPYAVDTRVFRPLAERDSARRSLGLPVDQFIILTGADCLDDARKGQGALVEALLRLPPGVRERVTVVAFGAVLDPGRMPGEWLQAGFVKDARLLNLYYNAADAYVLATQADNLPNTLLEAMAAGTVCAAFAVGGCREIVRDGQTGWTAPAGDVAAFSGVLLRMLAMTPSCAQDMRSRCRALAENEYEPSLQAKAYARLYADMAEQ